MASKAKSAKRDDAAPADLKARFLDIIQDGGTWRSARETLAVGNSTISSWMADDAFREQYARACDVRADAIFEEMLTISDDATNDWMEAKGDDADIGWRLNGDHVQRSKLRIETRKWMLGKMRPKVYGDKLELAGDPNAPLTVNVITRF